MMYEGIYDIPTFNWWEINFTGDLKFLLKDSKTEIKESKLKQRYQKIKDQFFDDIALNEDVEKYLLKKAKLGFYMCEILIGNDSDYYKTLYLLLEKELTNIEKEMSTEGSRMMNLETADILGKSQHHYIDIMVVPIARFHSMLNNFKTEQTAIKLENERRKRAN